MNTNPEPEPFIGDDGELLWDDTSVKPVLSLPPVEPPLELPRPASALPLGLVYKVALALVGLLAVVMLYVWIISSAYTSPVAENTLVTDHVVRDVRWPLQGDNLGVLTDEALLIWDLWHSEKGPANVTPQAFDWASHSPQVLIATATEIYLYDVDAETAVALSQINFDQPVSRLELAPDDNLYAVVSEDQRTLAIFSITTNSTLYRHTYDYPINDVDWFPNGKRLLFLMNGDVVEWENGKGVPYRVRNGDNQLIQAAILPDGTVILIETREIGRQQHYFLMRLPAQAGKTLWAIAPDWSKEVGRSNSIAEIKLTATEAYLATFIKGDKSLAIWSSRTGEQVDTVMQPDKEFITCIAWSPNGKYLAIGSTSQVVIVR